MTYTDRDFYTEFGHLGIEVLRVEKAKGTHVKVHCRFLGYRFIYVTSVNTKESDRGIKNRSADLQRIKRAIRSRNLDILNKFKVIREDGT